jgi:hypothetical protein
MSARTVFEAAVKNAGTSAVATAVTNEMTRQETINASGCGVGYTLQAGNYAALAAAVSSAQKAKIVADNQIEAQKQANLGAARDALRVAADFGPL